MATRLRGIFPSQTSSYSGKSENTSTPPTGFGIGSVMTRNGLGATGSINTDGVGQSGAIVFGFGIGSVMTRNGLGLTGLINTDGVGEEGDI